MIKESQLTLGLVKPLDSAKGILSLIFSPLATSIEDVLEQGELTVGPYAGTLAGSFLFVFLDQKRMNLTELHSRERLAELACLVLVPRGRSWSLAGHSPF